jgi:uncharacterized protein (DUF111 family)
LRLVVGKRQTIRWRSAKDRVGIIETTIDDATPELLSYVADCLMSAGASDVYRTPVQMKKGRIGTAAHHLVFSVKGGGACKS